MKLLKKAVRNNDFDTINDEAKAISRWALKLTEYFPKNSNPHTSEALNLIWEEFEQFETREETQIKASERLQQAGINRNSKAAAKAYSELAQSCKACLDDYRE
ncbi:cytochrome c [Pontibacterium granulatum]|uniref:cytochrome c n=1 Tax=Pontibacterium granulatum TaxID=2036029 RepID=UPI00249B9054|nr:cytochrome c [Pontibacterium granulatum]MDI3326277.1 cytochrome c [Pontibacterium granulatum]